MNTTLRIGMWASYPVEISVHSPCFSDCAYDNVMMDASPLYPMGFHPMLGHVLPHDITITAPCRPRMTTPVTYYFVDFGLSTLFSPDDTNRLVTGTDGLDSEVPELSATVPYDPFKVDVFILGNMFRKSFYEVGLSE